MNKTDAEHLAEMMLRTHGRHAKLFVRKQIDRCEADLTRTRAAAAWRDVLEALNECETTGCRSA